LQWVLNYASVAVVMVAVARLDNDERRWVLGALLISALFEAVWGINDYLGDLEPRSKGTFFNANYYGDYIAALAVWYWGQVIFHPFRRGKISTAARRGEAPRLSFWPKLLILLVLLIGVIVSRSRGAVIALFLGLVVVGMARWGLKVVPVLVVAALLGLLVPNPFVERLESLGEKDIYAWSRFDMWQRAIVMIRDHPMGLGAGMYQYYSYLYAFPVEKAYGRYAQVAESAHNALLDIATELGPLSLAIVLAVAIFLVLRGFRSARNGDVEAAGATGALAVILAHAAMDSIQKSPPAGYAAAIFAGALMKDSLGSAKRIFIPAPRGMRLIAVIFGLLSLMPIASTFLGWEFKMLARKCNAMRDPAGAEKWLERAVKVNPGYADLWRRLGDFEAAHWMNNRPDEYFRRAEQSYRLAIMLNPMDAEFKILLADLLLRSEEREKYQQTAIDLLEKAIAAEPYNPFFRTRTGTILAQMGKAAEAEKQFRNAIELEPRYAAAYVMLADLLASKGRRGEAALYYRTALQIVANPPPPPVSYYVRAMVDIKEDEVKKKLLVFGP